MFYYFKDNPTEKQVKTVEEIVKSQNFVEMNNSEGKSIRYVKEGVGLIQLHLAQRYDTKYQPRMQISIKRDFKTLEEYLLQKIHEEAPFSKYAPESEYSTGKPVIPNLEFHHAGIN